MAFLNNSEFRPACVISALPKPFRDSLSRELRGVVAVCTCPVEELESVVQSRGATVAIVGVSEKTVDVAERLSHSDRNLKVFLARYNNGVKTPLNGFAGVFDVRAEARRLADSIKNAIRKEQSFPSHEATFTEPVPNLLTRFVQLQRKIGNSPAFFDSMLEHLLGLTKGAEGFILVPDAMNEFRLVSRRGDSMPAVETEFTLNSHLLDSGCAFGDLLEFNESEARCLSWSIDDLRAVPLRSGTKLGAVFVSDRIHLSDEACEMISAFGVLFDQLTERESNTRRDSLVAQAQSIVVERDGWILVDSDGRIHHRNGICKSLISPGRGRIKEPRIRDLIARSFDGATAPIGFRSKTIDARTLITERGQYCILEAQALTPAGGQDDSGNRSILESLALIKAALFDFSESDGKALGDELIASLTEKKGVHILAIANRLKKLGVTIDFGGAEFLPSRAAGLGLILLMTKHHFDSLFTATVRQVGDKWILSVEFPENQKSLGMVNLGETGLIHAAVKVAGFDHNEVSSAVFGFQITGRD
jgi:hypothetical protein